MNESRKLCDYENNGDRGEWIILESENRVSIRFVGCATRLESRPVSDFVFRSGRVASRNTHVERQNWFDLTDFMNFVDSDSLILLMGISS